MRAILEFSLPEDEELFNVACKGRDLWFVWWNFSRFLKEELDNDGERYSDEEVRVLERVRNRFYEISDEYGINGELMS